jgi:CRP-like cAMP-binding protein
MFVLGFLDEADAEWLAQNGSQVFAPAGKVVVKEGTPLHSVYVLLQGELAVTVEGKPVTEALHAGEILGEISFIDKRPPVATVTATEDSTLLAVRKDVLHRKLVHDTKFAANFYHALTLFLAERLRTTTVRVSKMGPHLEKTEEYNADLVKIVSLGTQRFDALRKRVTQVTDLAC